MLKQLVYKKLVDSGLTLTPPPNPTGAVLWLGLDGFLRPTKAECDCPWISEWLFRPKKGKSGFCCKDILRASPLQIMPYKGVKQSLLVFGKACESLKKTSISNRTTALARECASESVGGPQTHSFLYQWNLVSAGVPELEPSGLLRAHCNIMDFMCNYIIIRKEKNHIAFRMNHLLKKVDNVI